MDNRKKELLLHLYGEAPPESSLRELLRDEELREEYRALSETKFRLDHRRRSRPDPSVIDAVVSNAAAGPDEVGARRGDRPAIHRLPTLRKLLVPAMSIAAALALAFSLGWWTSSFRSAEPAAETALNSDMQVPPESLRRFVPPVGQVTPASTDPRLAWDEPARFDMWYRRIESLRQASDPDEWGEPAVPLEMLSSPGQPGVVPAGTSRPNRR